MSKAKGSVKITPMNLGLLDDDKPLHNDDGSLTAHGMLTLRASINSPAWHKTVNLGVKGFKRYLRENYLLTKGQISNLVADYKRKAWADYEELVQFKGSFPTLRI